MMLRSTKDTRKGLRAPRRATSLLTAGCTALLGLAGAVHAQPAPTAAWTPTSSTTSTPMTTSRDAHSMVIVNGKVLVIGGRINSGGTTTTRTDYYDPATSKFTATGSMYYSRSFFPAVTLSNGKVLAVGGYRQSTFGGTIAYCEYFDPANGKWTRTGSMHYAREQYPAVALPSGKVLAAGGFSNNSILSSAELYDPATGTWTMTGTMHSARFGFGEVLLSSGPHIGQVMVMGGRMANNISLNSTEFYNPATGTWTQGPTMQADRFRQSTTLLSDGRYLITGGFSSTAGNCLDTAEIYDPVSETFTTVTDASGSGGALHMSDARMDHTATALGNGQVLVAGGWDSLKSSTVASADVFTLSAPGAVTGTFTAAAPLPLSRHEHAAVLLSNGLVLVTGGLRWEPSVQQTLNDAQLFG